jgi:hypothetical protein
LVLPKEWIENEILELLDQYLKSASASKLYDIFNKEIDRQKKIKKDEFEKLESKISDVERLQSNFNQMLSDVINNKLKIPDYPVVKINQESKGESDDPGLSIKAIPKIPVDNFHYLVVTIYGHVQLC